MNAAPGARESAGAGPALVVRHLCKRFGTTAAVDDVSFEVPGGAFLSLVGPSGSGKTTILRLLGGFERPDRGSIELGGVDLVRRPPHERGIGVVFQRYALFPHMTVAENVGFSLRQRGVPRVERAARVAEMLATVGLAGCGDRRPEQLSGGQQQRVALARALVFRPRFLLMDEPLAALDRHLREHLQREIRALQRRLRITTVYVTHDQGEALALSDLVAVVDAGRIEQLGTPRELYESPGSEFVARFMGLSNVLRGVPHGDGANAIRLGDDSLLRHAPKAGGTPPAAAMVRPERIALDAGPPGDAHNVLHGRVLEAIFLGETTEYRVAAGGTELVVRVQNRPGARALRAGDPVALSWPVADTVPL